MSYNFAINISAKNLATPSLNKLNSSIAETSKKLGGLSKLSNGFSKGLKFTSSASKSFAKLGAVGSLVGYGFKKTFLDTAISFEKYQTILKTLEGSSEAAKKSFDWVSDFAVKTPYELDQITESFVKLKSYGLDPINGGLLKSLGDTASAMGKPIMQAVEAIADAVTGENERLKEFGIKARVEKEIITYEYTTKAGETQTSKVKKSDRKGIQKALQTIFDEKFKGAMEDQSKTFAGMLSNLSDQWARFQMLVMDAGVFDLLKGKLKGILNELDKLSKNGELEKIALKWSSNFQAVINKSSQVITKLYSISSSVIGATNKLATFVGGWDNLTYAVVGFLSLKAAVGLATIGSSIVSIIGFASKLSGVMKVLTGVQIAFNVALIANPIGVIVMSIAAVGAGLYALYKNFAPFREFVDGLAFGIMQIFKSLWEGIKFIWYKIASVGELINKINPFSDEKKIEIKKEDKRSFDIEQIPTATIKNSNQKMIFAKENKSHIDIKMEDNRTVLQGVLNGATFSKSVTHKEHPLKNKQKVIPMVPFIQ